MQAGEQNRVKEEKKKRKENRQLRSLIEIVVTDTQRSFPPNGQWEEEEDDSDT